MNDILVKVGADITDFSRKMAESQRSLSEFGKANQQTFDAFKSTGKMVTGAGVALASGLGFAVKTAADFESAMSQVQAVSGASADDMELLSDKAREMGASTKFSASEAADGLYYMSLAGWDTNQMLDAIEPTLDLAAAANMDLARASDIVTDAMSIFGMEAEEAGRMTDTLAAAASSSNTDVDQMGEALQYVGANAHAAGMDIEQTSAFIGILADNGIKGSKAGTTLNAMLRDLKAGAEDGAVAVGDQSVALYDASGEMRDMTDVMDDLIGATDGMSDSQRDQALSSIMGEQALKGFNVYANEGVGVIGDLEEQLRNSEGAAGDMADIMQDNLGGALTELKSACEEIMISLGDALLPAIRKDVEWLQQMADWLIGLSDSTKSTIATIGAVAAAFALVAGPILMLIGYIPQLIAGLMGIDTVVKTVAAGLALLAGAVSWPVIAIVAALAAAAALIYAYWEPIKEFFLDLWEGIKDAGIAIWDALKVVWESTVTFFADLWSGISEFFAEIWESIKNVAIGIWDAVVEKWNEVVETVSEIFSPMIEFFANIWQTIKDTTSEIWETITDTLSTVWEGIKTIASNLWEGVKIAVLTPILALIQLLTGDFEGLRDTLSQIWGKIKDIASSTWGAIKDVVGALVDGLISNIQSLWEGAKSILTGIWSAIKETASNLWTQLKEGVINIVSQTKTAMSNKWNEIKTAVVDIVVGLKDDAIAKWEELKTSTLEKINGVKDNIINPLKEVDLLQIGKDIIDGLINGIKSKVNAVKDAVSDVASGITNKVKGILGLASPSKVLAQIGRWTGEGLAEGIEGTAGMVAKAADKLGLSAIPDERDIDLSYNTPAGMRQTMASAVRGTVDVNSRDKALIGAINDLRHDMTNLRVEMDGREVGKITEPYVSQAREERKIRKMRSRG